MVEPISKITDDIRAASSEGFTFLQNETNKLLNHILGDLKKLVEVSNHYKSNIEKSKAEWKMIKEEVEVLEKRKEFLKKREKDLDEKIERVNKEAESLASLHKVLDNRKKLLDEREVEVKTKERRAK